MMFFSRIAAASLLLLAVGCGDSPSRSPQGIVSLAPAMTETVVELGEQARLVAVSDYDETPTTASLPRVGTAMTPNFEAIARLRPALILLDQSGADNALPLERIAPVLSLPWLTLEDIGDGIRELGRVVAQPEDAVELATRLEATLDAPVPDGPRVLFVLDGPDLTQTWFLRSNSLHGRVLHAAGAINAVADPVRGAAVLAPEELLETAPDVIVVLAGRGDREAVLRAARERFSPLATVPAVAEGRIGAVIGEGYLLPGPGILDLIAPVRAEIDRLWP